MWASFFFQKFNQLLICIFLSIFLFLSICIFLFLLYLCVVVDTYNIAGREHVIFHITVPKCHWNLNFFAVLNMNELSPCFVVNFFVNPPTQFVFFSSPCLFCSVFRRFQKKIWNIWFSSYSFVISLKQKNCIIMWILLFLKALSLPKSVQNNKLDYCHLEKNKKSYYV
jgi:hypothetical protein